MNRDDFKELARIRIRESKTLLNDGKHSGAYYLAGYAVECAIKACISKLTNRYDFPDKHFANKVYSHNLEDLISAAGLKLKLQNEIKTNKNFAANWSTVKDWNEKSRYEVKSKIQARDLYQSITSKTNGILKWIRGYW